MKASGLRALRKALQFRVYGLQLLVCLGFRVYSCWFRVYSFWGVGSNALGISGRFCGHKEFQWSQTKLNHYHAFNVCLGPLGFTGISREALKCKPETLGWGQQNSNNGFNLSEPSRNIRHAPGQNVRTNLEAPGNE